MSWCDLQIIKCHEDVVELILIAKAEAWSSLSFRGYLIDKFAWGWREVFVTECLVCGGLCH